jgi:hypothetical protein
MASIPVGDSGDPRRLDGWKDISSYLNRSVRTVQRWEALHGLPIRRKGPPGGEVVFAFRSEIDDWLRSDGARTAHADSTRIAPALAPERSDAVDAESPRRVSVRFAVVAVVLCLALFIPVWSVYSDFRREGRAPAGPALGSGQAARWEPTAVGLRLLDLDRQPLCEVEFGVPFELNLYTGGEDAHRLAADLRGYHMVYQELPLVQVADVDGDGRRETAVVVKALDETKTSLRLYDDRCGLRWEYSASPDVRFGGESFAPPFHMFWVVVTPARGGGHDLWLSRRHQREHPSVLQRISPDRRVIGEYWHPGQITVVEVGRLSGRDVVAVGGVNNERDQAFLALLEKEAFGGVGPAEREKYRCTSCAPGAIPIAYVLFPRTELGGLAIGKPNVAEIRMHSSWLSVNVWQAGWGDGPSTVNAMTAYELGPDLTPIRWGYTDPYAWVHDRLFEAGRLPARFDRSTAPPLVPLQVWDGQRFRD